LIAIPRLARVARPFTDRVFARAFVVVVLVGKDTVIVVVVIIVVVAVAVKCGRPNA
jgi:hypothetical protein